ncbi:MAG: hypothetical protein SNJ53_07495, partial [Thermodesulfovibrionales bacterium]
LIKSVSFNTTNPFVLAEHDNLISYWDKKGGLAPFFEDLVSHGQKSTSTVKFESRDLIDDPIMRLIEHISYIDAFKAFELQQRLSNVSPLN